MYTMRPCSLGARFSKDQGRRGLVWSGLVLSVWSGLGWSGRVWSGLIWSGLVWSGLVLGSKMPVDAGARICTGTAAHFPRQGTSYAFRSGVLARGGRPSQCKNALVTRLSRIALQLHSEETSSPASGRASGQFFDWALAPGIPEPSLYSVCQFPPVRPHPYSSLPPHRAFASS